MLVKKMCQRSLSLHMVRFYSLRAVKNQKSMFFFTKTQLFVDLPHLERKTSIWVTDKTTEGGCGARQLSLKDKDTF